MFPHSSVIITAIRAAHTDHWIDVYSAPKCAVASSHCDRQVAENTQLPNHSGCWFTEGCVINDTLNGGTAAAGAIQLLLQKQRRPITSEQLVGQVGFDEARGDGSMCTRTERARARPQTSVTCETCSRMEGSKQVTSERRQVRQS